MSPVEPLLIDCFNPWRLARSGACRPQARSTRSVSFFEHPFSPNRAERGISARLFTSFTMGRTSSAPQEFRQLVTDEIKDIAPVVKVAGPEAEPPTNPRSPCPMTVPPERPGKILPEHCTAAQK